jgi:acetyl-CoA synthase
MVDWTIPGEAVDHRRAQTSRTGQEDRLRPEGKGMMLFLSDEIIEQLWK